MSPKKQGWRWVATQETRQTPVEQWTEGGMLQADESLWVVNPTACLWDPDDLLSVSGSGRLGKGETVEFESCLIADGSGQAHLAYVAVSDGLEGELQIGAVTVRTVEGRACIAGPAYQAEEGLPQIDSASGNGQHGHGLEVPVVFRVTNVGKRPLNKARAFVGVVLNLSVTVDMHCPVGGLAHTLRIGSHAEGARYWWGGESIALGG